MKRTTKQDPPVVLVIEHEHQVLESVTAALDTANIAYRHCTRPEEALAMAVQTLPNLILCDMSLFGESGPEICERIKQQPGLHDVPIVFLSSSQAPGIIRRSHGSCATYCIRKPFTSDVLVGLIDAAIEGRQPVAAAVLQA